MCIRDSFTVATVHGKLFCLRNYVHCAVTAVECDIRDVTVLSRPLKSRVEGNKLGQKAYFQCPLGYRLNGTANLTCQASGTPN